VGGGHCEHSETSSAYRTKQCREVHDLLIESETFLPVPTHEVGFFVDQTETAETPSSRYQRVSESCMRPAEPCPLDSRLSDACRHVESDSLSALEGAGGLSRGSYAPLCNVTSSKSTVTPVQASRHSADMPSGHWQRPSPSSAIMKSCVSRHRSQTMVVTSKTR
jgi:hypothetical protein